MPFGKPACLLITRYGFGQLAPSGSKFSNGPTKGETSMTYTGMKAQAWRGSKVSLVRMRGGIS